MRLVLRLISRAQRTGWAHKARPSSERPLFAHRMLLIRGDVRSELPGNVNVARQLTQSTPILSRNWRFYLLAFKTISIRPAAKVSACAHCRRKESPRLRLEARSLRSLTTCAIVAPADSSLR